MLFELRISFAGDEGDEVAVLDLLETFRLYIKAYTNVQLGQMELHVLDQHPCLGEGRHRATRN